MREVTWMARAALLATFLATGLATGLVGCGGGGGITGETVPPTAREIVVQGTIALSMPAGGRMHTLTSKGRAVYLAAGRDGLQLVDVRSLAAPTVRTLGARSTFPNPYDDVIAIAIDGNRMAAVSVHECICFGGSLGRTGIDLWDVSDAHVPRAAPAFAGLGGQARAVQLRGDYIHAARARDASDPGAADPARDGFRLERATAASVAGASVDVASVVSVMLRDGRLLALHAASGSTRLGFDEVDVASAAGPTVVSRSNSTPNPQVSLAAVEGDTRLFWIVGGDRLYSVRRDALSADPVVAALPEPASGLAWQGGSAPLLWVAHGAAGASAYDVADPARPRLVARVRTAEPAHHVSIHDGYGIVVTATELRFVPQQPPYLHLPKALHVFALP